MEQEIIRHDIFHRHPLSLIANLAEETGSSSWNNWCYGCWRYFLPGEAAYGCSLKCGFRWVLHKECMEMPIEIRHPLHPSHPLTLDDSENIGRCVVCDGEAIPALSYKCSGGCESLWIHMRCAGGLDAAADKEKTMEHPSHPHRLRFSKKTMVGDCDACGTSTGDYNSYICTICDYWIHESCALLPASAPFPPHHPNHSLSLAFHTPYVYIKYEFECAMCSGPLRLKRWVYHCHLCSYVIHISCATNTSSAPSNLSNNENAVDDEKDITKGPIDDIYEEIIRPFVKRERGETSITRDDVSGKYKFSNHPHHQLSFTTFSASLPSSSSHPHNKEEENEDGYDDDDDDDDNIPRSELTCDGCTLPIQRTNEKENGYMSCDECKYFLHLSCFNLPPELPSQPLHHHKDHNLTLRNAGKLTDWAYCTFCTRNTNGLYYACTNKNCSFEIDIKCASLPNTIKHAAHSRHNYLKLVMDDTRRNDFCRVCYYLIDTEMGSYRCNSCKFCICVECVLLPAHNKHRLEKHWLPLTYDAYVNRPGEFYCSSCEDQMNPRMRMYYCRDCDQSFHPECFPDTSGEYRNINCGNQQYVIPSIHDLPHHPLRFQIITKKKRCDLCHRATYDEPGFQCASCNFIMCLNPCSVSHRDAFKVI